MDILNKQDDEARMKEITGGVDSVYGDGSAQYIGKAIEAFSQASLMRTQVHVSKGGDASP